MILSWNPKLGLPNSIGLAVGSDTNLLLLVLVLVDLLDLGILLLLGLLLVLNLLREQSAIKSKTRSKDKKTNLLNLLRDDELDGV